MAVLAKRVSRMLADAERATLERCAASVGELQAALRDTADAVQAYARKGWLRRLAAPGGDTARFRDLHDRIMAEMSMLQFDVALTAPAWRDESKALRAAVLERTGKTVEEGGLEELVGSEEGREAVKATLGADARALAAELDELSRKLDRVGAAVDATLNIELTKELRNALQLNVQLTQPSKKSASGCATAGRRRVPLPPARSRRAPCRRRAAHAVRARSCVYLQEATVLEGMFSKKVAAFRVTTGHAVEMRLSVSTKDGADLRVRGIERVQQAEATYVPAQHSRARWCCGSAPDYFQFVGMSASATLFGDDDVDIPLDEPRSATVTLTLPDDAGPRGEVLKLALRMWVSFEPSPALGEGFDKGKTVTVKQPLYFAVYKKGSSRFLMRDVEDATTKQRRGMATLAAPVLGLSLMVHKNYMQKTEGLLRKQLIGWDDGSPYELQR